MQCIFGDNWAHMGLKCLCDLESDLDLVSGFNIVSILKDRTVYSISSQSSFLWLVLHHGLFLKVVLVCIFIGAISF